MKRLWNRIWRWIFPPQVERRIRLYTTKIREDAWQDIYSICLRSGGKSEVALVKIRHEEKCCWVGFTHVFDDLGVAESVILEAKCLFLDHSINL